MPFQTSASSKVLRVGQVTLISAGEDSVDICAVTIPLEAIIVGDTTGHTLLWEQLTGAPVIIDDPTSPTTFFTQAGGGDKTFRFTIDQGTVSEQFDDVTAFDTPNSPDTGFGIQTDGGGLSANAVTKPLIFPVTVANGSIVNTPETPPAQPFGEATVNQVFTLTWNHPGQTNDNYIVQYEVREATVPVANVPSVALTPTASGTAPLGPPSDPRSYALGAITSYEVLTRYSFHGDEREELSDVFDFTGTPVDPVKAIDDTLDGGFGNPEGGQGTSFAANRFATEILQVPNDVATAGFSQQTGISYTEVRFSSELIQTPNDIATAGFSQNAGFTTSFTRFDPSGIGGGGG